jgi:multidrug resistance efflux pump
MPGHQASRPHWPAAIVVPLAASLVVGMFGCAEPNRILVSGNVDDDLVTVQAPQIEIAEPDLDAGFADTETATPASPKTAGKPMATWNRVATVDVHEGDQVQAGQVLMRFDSAALRADLRVAHANARVAATQIPVLDSAIDKTFDKEDSIKSALTKINKAIRQLRDTRTQLSGQLAQARRQLPQLEAKLAQVKSQRQQLREKLGQVNQQLAQLQKTAAQLPPEPPNPSTPSAAPPAPNRQQLLAAIAKLRQGRMQLQTGLKQLTQAEAQLTTAIARLRFGIPKLESAIGKIDDGLAKARTQRAKLRKARTKIIDARAELRRTRKLAVVAADAATVGVRIAKNQKLLSTVNAPASGVVVDAATAGAVLAPGATVATIRKGTAASLTTWLSPAQLAQICLGSQAAVHADWMTGQTLDATITLIGDRADYPPTAFATDEVHLTRAVPVRLTLTRSTEQPLPPGAPVDIDISPAANDHSCSTGTTSR